MELGLRDRVCLVTGSTTGIGLATARLLAEEGALVVVSGRDRERVARAQAESGAAFGVASDLAEPDAPAELIARSEEELGPLDCLVNNVGVAYQADFAEVSDAQWDEMWQLNVMSYVRAIRAARFPRVDRRAVGRGVAAERDELRQGDPGRGFPNA